MKGGCPRQPVYNLVIVPHGRSNIHNENMAFFKNLPLRQTEKGEAGCVVVPAQGSGASKQFHFQDGYPELGWVAVSPCPGSMLKC